MGYLINSTSFRLGLSLKWHQRTFMFTKFFVNGFMKNINFNDYFEIFYRHNTFAMMSYTFSHVTWYNQYKYALINIYVFHGKFEEWGDDFFGKWWSLARKTARVRRNRSLRIRYRWSPRATRFYKLNTKRLYREIIRRIIESRRKRYYKPYVPYIRFMTHVMRLRTYYKINKKNFILMRNYISNDFNKILCKPVKVQLCDLTNNKITTDMCMRYIKLRLEQFNRFNEIVYPLIRAMRNRLPFVGLRIRCAGRISRQQRASKHQARRGFTSFNTYSYPVEFSYGSAILKYGMASIRVWLYRRFTKRTSFMHFSFHNFFRK
jgi:hypothetical protein